MDIIKETISLGEFGELYFTKDHSSFKEITNRLPESLFVKISTYNISGNNEELLTLLKSLSPNTQIVIVTNIPGRWDDYWKPKYREGARKIIQTYLLKLDPENFQNKIKVYFNFHNHSKIIVTDNLGYIGSANFSKESANSFEAGIIIRSKAIITDVIDRFFDPLITRSTRYFGGKLQRLAIELENNLVTLTAFEKEIVKINSHAIWLIQQGDHPIPAIQANADNLEELEILTLDFDDVFTDIERYLHSIESTTEIRIIGNSIRGLVERESILRERSKFNMDWQITKNKDQNWINDTGENGFELEQVAQENALEQYEQLNNEAGEKIIDLNNQIGLYQISIQNLILMLNELDDAERSIDNTDS
ncbi:hypothetical protein G7092_16765 [Mucilaginibacter sp. HC2]|uniref:phospholipase D-like domain-containing protein n=1 Tax=Mucilaginibacter inviolabilis TaxID=2714892 RepID=UPI00140E8842|nr:phospholipase D-like domain-containing protein [Mucilaginibacter inviolabilis]NHA05465.1 hypothetical protein [Mucilaginibacter inviolabilis]